MATGFNPAYGFQLGLPAVPTFQTDDQELKIEFERIYKALQLLATKGLPDGVTVGFVLTDNGPGVPPSFQASAGGGGLTRGQVQALFDLVPVFL